MDARADELIDHAASLERRDSELAEAIARLVALAARVDELRRAAAELGEALVRLPLERAEAESSLAAAGAERAAALQAAHVLERRQGELEGARRVKVDELDQTRRELQRAREDIVDVEARAARHAERSRQLGADEEAALARRNSLAEEASAVADEIRETPRVPEAGNGRPGGTLPELEEWGGQVRAALFVARGGLETERARVVEEANALGAAVLGEPLGASSAALVRRRVAERLGSVPERD